MEHVALILVCLAVGVGLRLSGQLPETAPKVFGGWVIYVALPAAALHSVHDISVNLEWLVAAATPWIGALLAIAVFVPLSQALGWSRQRTGALILVAGWGNTSFVGLPMIDAYFGSNRLGLGLFIDLAGSYLALSTIGITVATVCAGDRFDGRAVLRRIATFPPFIAIIIALATNDLARPNWLDQIFEAFALTLTPVALAAVGFAIRFERIGDRIAPLGAGLAYRLALAPLAILAIYAALGQMANTNAQVAIFEMAMPPSLGASIIAMNHDLEPELVALLIGIGIPLSMATVPLWWLVMGAG